MAPSDRRGFVTTAETGRPLPGAGGALLASAAETGGLMSVIHSTAPAGDHVPLHVHHAVDEAFYVLDGEYVIRCGDDSFTAGAGAFVFLPRGVPHSYRVGDRPATKLVLGLPGGLEDFFDDLVAGMDPDTLANRHRVSFLDNGPWP